MNETIPNKELIDATQDAVLNAASSVADVLENTAQGLSSHGAEPFYLHAEFWVGAAFVLVVVGLAKPVGKALAGLLKGRGEAIANRIKEAVNLKEDAQKLLAEYERKFRNTNQEAAEILAKSEREIEALKKETFARLESDMASKERDAKARLKAAEENATQEVADKTADLTISAVRKILHDRLDQSALDQLIDESISRLDKIA